ncbi:MAG: 4-hydroxy-tetrahydrodipicolinate reductase, partial [Armatimonadota bacterium]
MSAIRVLVIGAAGRMGREVVRAVASQSDMSVVAAVDQMSVGRDAGALAGIDALGV